MNRPVRTESERVVSPWLRSPFPPRCHPDLGPAAEANLAWARGLGLLTSPSAVARFTALRPALLAAGAYAAVERSGLLLAADWCSWLFLFDDQGDESPIGRDPVAWQARVRPVEAVVRGDAATPDGLPPLAAALHDLLSRTLPGMSGAWTGRFRRHLAAYVASYADEARHRAGLLEPRTAAAYITHRRDSGAMRVVFDLLEPTHRVELPDDWFHSREHQDVYLAASDVVCWENDIVSLRKELARADVHSLPLVIRAATGCSLQSAVDRSAGMLHARIDYYLAAERLAHDLLESSGLPAATREAVRLCLTGYRTWMRSNHDFGTASGRYRHVVRTEPDATPDYIEPLL